MGYLDAMPRAMKAPAAMKAMKVKATKMKVMKAMKAKSVIAKGIMAKSLVFKGFKTKSGKIVSKARSARAKKAFGSTLGTWNKAVAAARKALGIEGFCPMGGKSAQGKALYAKTKSLYNA